MLFIRNDASFFVPVTSYLYAFLMDYASSSSASEIQCSSDNKEKKCPGFGDTLDLIACCPSKVETGDYYCCTLDEKRRIEYSWKDDFAENFAEIIGGVVAALLVTFTLVVVCCFFCSCCYLHRHRRRRQRDSSSETCRRSACPCPNMNSSDDAYCGSRSNGQVSRGYRDGRTSEPLITSQPPYHRHQQGLNHFQPKPYDAPPPYPIAQQCPAFNPPPFVHNMNNNAQREVEFRNSNNNNLHNNYNNNNQQQQQRTMNNAQQYADAWDDETVAKTC